MAYSEALISDIKNLAPAGFRVVRNAAITDTIIDFVDGHPEEWAKVYTDGGFVMGDPVFLWSALKRGVIRWSEIEIADFHGVLEKAKEYGLNFGVVASRLENGRISLLSVARSDREYTDAEVDLCNNLLERALSEAESLVTLKPLERDVLVALSQGETLQSLAKQTGASISTIKNRLSRARTKLGAKTTIEAVVVATRRGLI